MEEGHSFTFTESSHLTSPVVGDGGRHDYNKADGGISVALALRLTVWQRLKDESKVYVATQGFWVMKSSKSKDRITELLEN
ncbi:hypothetical protein EYF80_020194 [Liparis tanakae]|uniref:Uncharacterized protein n=1 Tax=Liparis tanakae TaxID=230148 RepID=A0A4Z2HUP4_9TELE|nr:hypothetical protein EYF80_020194 [Liparis tanakae]